MPHAILGPTHVRRDARGELCEVVNGFPARALLAGRMKAGAVMGNHYHRRTRVFFYLQSGKASVRTVHAESGARDSFELSARQGVILEPNESHAISFETESEWLMLKSEAYDPEEPDTYDLVVPD